MKTVYIVRKNNRKVAEFNDRHTALNFVRRKIRASKEWKTVAPLWKLTNPAPSEFGYTIQKVA